MAHIEAATTANARSLWDHIPNHLRECVLNCLECHAMCLETVASQQKGGLKPGDEKLGRLLLDCADICQTAADFMIRGSELHGRTCGLCAEICKLCAQGCERVGWKECADVCRRCADSCDSMSQKMH